MPATHQRSARVPALDVRTVLPIQFGTGGHHQHVPGSGTGRAVVRWPAALGPPTRPLDGHPQRPRECGGGHRAQRVSESGPGRAVTRARVETSSRSTLASQSRAWSASSRCACHGPRGSRGGQWPVGRPTQRRSDQLSRAPTRLAIRSLLRRRLVRRALTGLLVPVPRPLSARAVTPRHPARSTRRSGAGRAPVRRGGAPDSARPPGAPVAVAAP